MPLVVRVSLCVVLSLVVGCPRPLAEAPEGTALTAPDAVAVLRLPSLARAEDAARAYLKATRGSARSDVASMLRFVVEGKGGSALLGLARARPLLVSWRETGEAIVTLPVEDPALFSVALDRLLDLRGAARGSDVLGRVRVYREVDGSVAMLARIIDGGALLWPAPRDTLAAAALLNAMGEGRVVGRWPTRTPPPASTTAAAEGVASGAGLARLSPSLSALFGGPSSVKEARGELVVDGGAVRLELTVQLEEEARALVASQVADAKEPPSGFCALVDNSLAIARGPVALLRSTDDDGPLDDLAGQLAVAIISSSTGTAPGWIALGRPAGLVGKEELLASVRAGGVVERRQEALGPRSVRVFVADGAADETALLAVADDDLFALAFRADDALEHAVSSEDNRCAGRPAGESAIYLRVRPEALSGALSAGSPSTSTETPDPVAALQRLTGRLPEGFSVLEASARLNDDGVRFEARGELGSGR